MELTLAHECNRDTRKEIIATINDPYHFVDSGLSNVSLVGIRFFRCECGRELAEIPAVRQLLSLIARDLVEKSDALAPEEIRFLRKRLGKKQADFGKEIGLRPETLSRMENGDTRVNERADKIIRLYYAFKSQDSILLEKFKNELQDILASWRYSSVPSKIVATRTDDEWENDLRAA
jgi:transcriptional regulator with XRE-family HTH domain